MHLILYKKSQSQAWINEEDCANKFIVSTKLYELLHESLQMSQSEWQENTNATHAFRFSRNEKISNFTSQKLINKLDLHKLTQI